MVRKLILSKDKEISISKDAGELFPDNFVKATNGNYVLEIMNNCLDTIFEYVHNFYPKVFRPMLFLSN